VTQGRIRILCVDDHRIVREGISLIIGLQPDMEVVASAATGEEAQELYRRLRPDVTLMDLQLPTVSGVDTIRAIRHDNPDARIIVLTMYQGDEDIYRALDAGAAAYLLKDMLTDELVTVVRAVHAGERPMPTGIQARLEERAAHPAVTSREIQVLELIAEGLRNKEIAARLVISEETVHAHVKNLFAKLGVSDRTAAVTVALRRGIIHIR
jgi:two-component system NarL family response regulator